ncbi:MAG: bis(5'-nucleosyl)-tetraphosphatase (symmetrical) YqeK [Coriobacteriia bacterium]|nr:bis(5'-nucleosyl)-tetraphosphatase (symmetrical) YqeK [Coriobacteriia bacterium]MCL2746330.1 bis(5'-nucleosyl)-tetraphosphatase (symmetrical) YqeK [Coriobacteriia bacterium]MCL2871105.1 bis(5'-nucleosyl)-tetraphosphatase (symmetrical) YqeK [Coriobacteriia bacterium]
MSQNENSTPNAVDAASIARAGRYGSIVQQALPLLKERLDDYGYLHSCKAAETAYDLAFIYQADREEAYIATLLHDWDRGQPKGDLVDAAQKVGIEITPEVLAAPQMLHAHTGAAQIEQLFPELPDTVITAIKHHTVGDEDMSDLDKVLYIADMIEPTRSSPRVTTLREMVGTIGLDALFQQAYQATMLHLIHNRKVMHPRTTEVWNALTMKGIPASD